MYPQVPPKEHPWALGLALGAILMLAHLRAPETRRLAALAARRAALRPLLPAVRARSSAFQRLDDPELVRVGLDAEGEMLEMQNLVDEGVVSRFPYVFLRDNCVCESCFHSNSSSRLTSFSVLDLDDRVVQAQVEWATPAQDTRLGRVGDVHAPATAECVRLQWSSGHESVYPLTWLRERCFSDTQQRRRTSSMDLFSLLEETGVADAACGAEVTGSARPVGFGRRESQCRHIPRFPLERLATDSTAMLGWCHAMEKYGVAIVQTDNTSGVLKTFTELFGFREWWCVARMRLARAAYSLRSPSNPIARPHSPCSLPVCPRITSPPLSSPLLPSPPLSPSTLLLPPPRILAARHGSSYGEFYVVENKQSAAPPPDAADASEASEGAERADQKQANNLAYTGLPLQFHTDLPHYASPPQVQLLHCISQTSCEGGANKLVDGFAVAEYMREHHPAAFQLLTSVRMEYKDFHREVLWDSGPGGDTHSDGAAFGGRPNDTPRLGTRREVDFFLRYGHPVISLDDPSDPRTSRVSRINYSDHHRDSVLNYVSADQVRLSRLPRPLRSTSAQHASLTSPSAPPLLPPS